ncbi:DMT family transporter [Roseinatronobacter sp.]|uniref:DMT family transporter n=1 Tax=Roseinatronobacter sp. TaxID=1945755 RepID=UPI0025DB5589|nr:DMT family transporter [Rhodobaca sp.]
MRSPDTPLRLGAALAVLVAIGALWGLGAPMVRFARLAGLGTFSVVLWQSAVGLVVLCFVQVLRGRFDLPRDPASLLLYAVVGLLGIVLPHLAGYWALGHIPAGVHALLTSLVPMFALALALGLRIERFRILRAFGLCLGAVAVALLVLPEQSLPASVPVAFVFVSALAPLCYALESAFVAHMSRAQAGALQALLGGSVVALLVMVPVTLVAGQPVLPQQFDAAILALILSGASGALAYAGYVALLRRAGSVFATQVAYLVTAWAMLWSVLILGERHSPWVWLALVLMFAGLFLVQPRPRLAPTVPPVA